MTKNKQFKLAVRRYAAEHGLAYCEARRRVLEARNATNTASDAEPDDTPTPDPGRAQAAGSDTTPEI